MARRVATLACFALAAGLIFGSLGLARSKMEAEAHRPEAGQAPPVGTPTAPATTATPSPPDGPGTPVKQHAGKVVYLTFDDGPDPAWTPEVLATLKKYDAKATFFMLRIHTDTYPELVQQVRDAGMAIGNHSVDHKYLPGLSAKRLHQEVANGIHSRCFRPPYGATNARVRKEIHANGMQQVLWDVDPQDWARPGSTAIRNRVLSHVFPGSVVLMHDGGGNRSQTGAALDRILQTLKARGYSFRSLSC